MGPGHGKYRRDQRVGRHCPSVLGNCAHPRTGCGSRAFQPARVERGHPVTQFYSNGDVNDEAYTNVAAATALRIATQAARVVEAAVSLRLLRSALGRRRGAARPQSDRAAQPCGAAQPAWHGHRFTIAIKGEETRLSIDSGGPLPVTIAGHPRTVLSG